MTRLLRLLVTVLVGLMATAVVTAWPSARAIDAYAYDRVVNSASPLLKGSPVGIGEAGTSLPTSPPSANGVPRASAASVVGAETEAGVADAAGGGSGGPSFITNSNGETIPVPEGARGPTPVESGKGFQFTGGSGGNGLDSRVAGVRVMDPVTGGKYPYPNGYISYMNAEGQTVNPWTGQTVSNADPWAHWPWSP
jgi:hypothetical protein